MSTTTEHNAQGACDRLLDYVYDELGPEDKTAFEAHVTTCARCQAELATFRRVRTAVRTALPVVEPPANAQGAMHAQLMHAAAQRKPPEMGKLLAFGRKTRKVLLSPAFAMAAMFLVVGSVLAVRFSKGPLMEPRAVEAPAAPAAPVTTAAEKAEAPPAPEAAPTVAASPPTTTVDETLAHGESGKIARGTPGKMEQKESAAPRFRATTKGSSGVDAKLLLDAAKPEPEKPARFAQPKLETSRELKNNEENRRDTVQPPEGNMSAKKRLGGLDDGLGGEGVVAQEKQKAKDRAADKPAEQAPSFGWGARKSGEKAGQAPSSSGYSLGTGSTTRQGAGGRAQGGTWNAQPQQQNMDSWDVRNAPGSDAEMQVQSTTRPSAAKPAAPPPPPAATAPAPVADPKLQIVDGALARNKQTSSPSAGVAQQQAAPAPQQGAYWHAAETQRKKAEDLAAAGRCEDAIRIYAQLEKAYPGYKISPKDRRPYENCLKLTGRTQQVPESEGDQVKRREKAPARPSVDEDERSAESVRKAPPAKAAPEPTAEPKPAPKPKKRAPSKTDDYASPYESPSQAAPADKPSL
jgi:hypothetical protein